MSEAVGLDYRFYRRYGYAIVDAEQREEIPQSWGALPIAPDFLRNDIARCPLLIDFSALPQNSRNDLLVRLQEETAQREATFVALALASSRPARLLLAHLKKRLAIHTSQRDKPRQFRYFDPGTFIQLPDVLGDRGMTWLLGPVAGVAVPWLGEWRSYENPQTPEPWRFSVYEHLDELQKLSVINRVLTQLANVRDQSEWQEAGRKTRRIVDDASRIYGLQARDDLLAFALHAWQWGQGFDRHPIVQQLLAELAAATPEDELDYRELSARLHEADWKKIAVDLQGATPTPGAMP